MLNIDNMLAVFHLRDNARFSEGSGHLSVENTMKESHRNVLLLFEKGFVGLCVGHEEVGESGADSGKERTETHSDQLAGCWADVLATRVKQVG
jgi:hypothetical protein